MQQSLTGKPSTKILQKVDIFISSPGDVQEERKIAESVIRRLNRVHSIAERYILQPLMYEDSVPATVGQRPQTVIDRYMMEASKSDIYVCILWQRMGTPTLHEASGEQFQSGTEYEFTDAYRANQKSGKPQILLYRGMKPVASEVDPEQFRRVQVFFKQFEGENAPLKGLYKTYRNNEEFEDILFHDLDKVIYQLDEQINGLASMFRPAHADFLREDWGEAPHRGNFYGREKELIELKQWIEDDSCQLVALLGIGGMGKTTLAATLTEQIKGMFSYVYWRSLQNAPSLESILQSCIPFLTDQQQIDLPGNIDEQISLLIENLRKRRCLLVLDNFESVLQSNNRAGQYQAMYEGYGKLLRRIGENQHRSCLLLTSREKPDEIAHLEEKTGPVRSLQIPGLGQAEGQEILQDKGLSGYNEAWTTLIHFYSGNPLALKLVSEPIRELFGGDVAEFLNEGARLVENTHDLLEQQFKRLTALEREIMYWLAIEREAVSLNTLAGNIFHIRSKRELLGALESLRRRSLVDSSSAGRFTLQPVIMEYVTDELVELMYREIESETIGVLASHAFIKAQSKEYVRDAQVRFILTPITERLFSQMGRNEIEKKLKNMLSNARDIHSQKQSYLAGNILNLLIHLKYEIRGFDFSHLEVRQAYLQGVELHETNFAYAKFVESVFTETFGNILSVAFSPNGELLAAGTTNGEVRIWQIASSTQILNCKGHGDWVWSIAFSPDGNILASGSSDRTIRLWDTKTGQCLRVLQGHNNSVWSITFSPDGNTIASSGEDHTIKLWDIKTGQNFKTLQEHTERIWSITFSHDGDTIASGSYDKTVRLWDVNTGHCLKTLEHADRVQAVAFSPDRQTLASGSDDGNITIWEINTGLLLNTLQGHTNWLGAIAFNVDGSLLASGSYDQTVRLWDVRMGKCLNTMQGHTSWVGSVVFSPDGSTLATGSYDQSIRLWEISTGQCAKILEGYSRWVGSVAFSPDGSKLISSSENYNVRIWDASTGQSLQVLRGHTGRVWSVAFAPDEKTGASASEDWTIKIWEVSSGQCLKTLLGHSSWARTVAFSPDGSTLASGGYDQTVRLWDINSGQCLKVLQEHTNRIWPVVFSPDGQILVSGSEDQTIRLWEVSSGNCLKILRGHSNWISSVAFSFDGQLLVSGCEDQTIRIWEVSSGNCLKILQGHSNPVKSAIFNRNGDMIVSGSIDQTIKIWNINTGECLNTLQGHSRGVWTVAFSPDERILASSSLDGTIKLWAMQTGDCIKTVRSDGPYENMNIAQATGLTDAQKDTLRTLGAIESSK